MRWSSIMFALAILADSSCVYLHNVEDKASSPADLTAVIADVHSKILAAHPLVLSDTASKAGLDRFLQAAGALQCSQHTDNPVVPVIGSGLQLTLQGQINSQGTFTVSATPSVGATVARQSQQTLVVPVAYVALRNMPEYYTGQIMTNLQYVSAFVDKNDAPNSKLVNEEMARVFGQISLLSVAVTTAMSTYDASKCGKLPPPRIIVPTPGMLGAHP